ncbi:putative aldouronate transport system permease protein [Streptacidiphilus sp. MAP5-52]
MTISSAISGRRWRSSLAPEPRPAWQEKPKAATSLAKGSALILITAIAVVPFWVELSTSLSTNHQLLRNGAGFTLWPQPFSLQAYRGILQGGLITKAVGVSLGLTLVGTAASLATTVLLAYALSRPGVTGGKQVLMMCLFAFLFPPGLIPTYLVVDNLHLLNTYSSLVLPVLVNVFNLVVMRGFFQGIPSELYEAARLDGAGEWTTLLRIVLPLSKPVIAVVGFFYAVTYWNQWFQGLFYLNDASQWPLGTLLRLLVTQGSNVDANGSTAAVINQNPIAEQAATVVLAILPILLVYPFTQRFFTKGVLTGAVKS